MPQDLLSPDEFGQMLDDPEFAKLPFDTRKTYVEKGIGEASRFIAERDGGWTPELWQNFGAAAQQARQFVSESETLGETAMRYAGVAGQTIKDLPAIIGTGVVGLSPVLPDGQGGVTGQVPGETLGPALGRNIVGLAASGAAMLSDAEQPMVKQIDTLKQQIDQGEFLTHKKGFQGWMDEQNAAVREKQKAFYQNEDWADQNSLLGSAENVKLMQDYLSTRSPQSWAALQDNLLRTPFRAKLQADQQALQNDTKLGRALAPEARPLISEAADPAELLPGMLAVKKGVQIATKGASAGSRALDAAKGIAGEMLGEQVSATIDNPYLSAAERLQVAKDSLAGSLGLMGVGAGAKAAVQALSLSTINSEPSTNDPLPPNQTPAPAGTPQTPGATPGAAPLAGAAGPLPSTLSRIAQESLVPDLPEDTGELTADEVADLEGVGQTMSDPSTTPPTQTPLTPGERAPADQIAQNAIAGVTAEPAQTITGSNVQTGTEMPVPSPTAPAGAGTGAMVAEQPVAAPPNELLTPELETLPPPPTPQVDTPAQTDAQPVVPELLTPAQLQSYGQAQDVTNAQARLDAAMAAQDRGAAELAMMTLTGAKAGSGPLATRAVRAQDEAVTLAILSARPVNAVAMERWAQYPATNAIGPDGNIPRRGIPAKYAKQGDVYVHAEAAQAQDTTIRQGLQNLQGGNRSNAGSTTLPGAAADALVNLASAAVRAGQTFAQWATSMLQRFGEAVRQYLQGAWQAAMRTSEVGAVDIFNGKVRGMTTSAVEVLHNDSTTLAKPKSKVSNDEVAKALQDAAVEQWGEIITSDNITPEQEAILVANGTDEFVAAFRASGKTAADWYTTNIESAMAVANVIHEELKSDQAAQAVKVNGQPIFRNKEDAQLALYLAMAITSQNLNVNQNTTYAEEQFQIFKATGKFDTSRLYGEKAKSISANLDLANNVLKELGWQDLHQIIKTTYTVRELSSILSKWTGKNVKIAGRLGDQVQGAAIFGPKIGQGFLQNLMGNYLPVTIDLWMRRTWGRWTGDVLGDGLTGERLARLTDEVRNIGLPLPTSLARMRPVVRKTEKGKSFRTMSEEFMDRVEVEEDLREQLNDYAKEIVTAWGRKYNAVQSGITKAQMDGLLTGTMSMDAVATTTLRNEESLNTQWEAKANKPKGKGAKETWKAAQRDKNGRSYKLTTDQWNGTVNGVKNVGPKLKPQWALAANVIRTQLKPIDAPSDQDRAVISRIVNKIRVELEAQGITVSNADIQAVLWYPEKDLWAKLRGEEESNLKQSYEDEFLKLARERGIGIEAEAAAARVRAARTGGPADQNTNGGISQGSVSAGKTQGGGFKNLNVSGRTAGFLNTDILNEATDLLRSGITDFANWSRAMVSRFGRAIQEFLAGIWQQITSPQTNAAQNVRMGRAQGTAPVTLGNSGAVLNPFTPSDAPGWMRTLFKVPSVGAFRVQNLSVRKLLTGSALPTAMADIVTASDRDKKSIEYAAAALANDLEQAMQAHSAATGQTQQQVNDLVSNVLQGALPLTIVLNPELRTAIRRARNLLDSLSTAVAGATSGQMGSTILANLGSWMRRSYAAFDPAAGWSFDELTKAAAKGRKVAGEPAAKILNDARRYLRSQTPGLTLGELEAQMRQLMDRNLWEEALIGSGAGVRKDVSSLMKRKDIAPEIRALMGEERNPVKKLIGSAKWQAQFVAKHENQQKIRDVGLQLGMFSPTQTGRFTEELGEDRSTSGFALNGKKIYTTPELRRALSQTTGVLATDDLGSNFLKMIYWLGGQAKLNKVALNPDSWVVNLLGNFTGLAMTGGLSPFAPLRLYQNSRKAIELLRSGKKQAAAGTQQQVQNDLMRQMMAKLTAAGVADSSMNAQLVEDALNKNLIQFIERHDVWNGAVGAVKLAVVGQALAKPFGAAGRAVGGVVGGVAGYTIGNERVQNVQEAIAKWTMQNPDRFGKIVEFLDNQTTLMASGMTPDAAFAKATQKTLNTMPDYSKLPAVLRQFSRLGVVGSFIAFQWEVYRNSFHNLKYIAEELGSGNPALMEKGARRLLGMGAVYALALGGLQAILGNGDAGDDEKDEAYRRALGKPWEKYSRLAYTQLDTEKASFYNTSYLLPQVTLTEILRAAAEGKDFAQALEQAGGVLQKQFAETGIHADPLLALLFNFDKGGQKATTEEGWRATLERLGEILAPMTPGAADKFERLLRSKEVLNAPRWDREFSVAEEMKRLFGIRQATYAHDRRIAGRLSEFNSRKRDITTTAAQVYGEAGKARADVWGRQAQQQAADRATERLNALKAEYDQFVQDLGTLGFKPTQIERFRKDAGTSPNWKPYGITPEGIKQP